MGKRIKIGMLILAATAILALLAAVSHEESPDNHRVELLPASAFEALLNERTAVAPALSGTELRAFGCTVPYDESSHTFLIPISGDGADLWENLTWHGYRQRAFLPPEATADVKRTMAANQPIALAVTEGDTAFTAHIKFTSLPVIVIDDRDVLKIVQNSEKNAHFTLLDPESGYTEVKSNITYRPRGRSSLGRPKQSYRFSLYQSNGKRKSAPLLSMPENREWILVSMYDDYARVRDKVTLDLWNDMCSSRGTLDGRTQLMEYVEVFIDNEYRGLYGLLTPFTRESQHLAIQEDFLYKIVRYNKNFSEAAELDDLELYRKLAELEWPRDDAPISNFQALALFTEAFFSEPNPYTYAELCAIYDMDQAVDRNLMLAICSASDNELRNNFFSIHLEDGKASQARFIPYDLTLSWGRPDDFTLAAAYQADNSQLYDQALMFDMRLLMEKDPADVSRRIRDRWAELRADLFSVDSLYARFVAEERVMTESGAFARETARWTEYPLNHDMTSIRTFIEKRLDILDRYYAKRLPG